MLCLVVSPKTAQKLKEHFPPPHPLRSGSGYNWRTTTLLMPSNLRETHLHYRLELQLALRTAGDFLLSMTVREKTSHVLSFHPLVTIIPTSLEYQLTLPMDCQPLPRVFVSGTYTQRIRKNFLAEVTRWVSDNLELTLTMS